MIFTIRNRKIFRKIVAGIFAALFWVGVWQMVYLTVGLEILVASPAQVWKRLLELVFQREFWLTVLFSMCRIVEGFLLGVFLGIVAAVFSEISTIAQALIRPMVSIIKATPVASFIILALVWMKSQMVPVFASALIVLPILWTNLSEGIEKTDNGLLQMAKMYGFGTIGTVRSVYLPSVLPYFTAACTAGMGMAWKGGVAAEVLSSLPLSLGGEIYRSKIYLETVDLFAWTAVVILLSVLLERALLWTVEAVGKRYGFYSAEVGHEN
ncbi:MAG: ABC transmembrane type-1 domain-containing protein [Oscillospiraceae bacterium]|jgi:NitT/TauT family transport system permease protein